MNAASTPAPARSALRPSLMLAAVSLLGFGLLYSLAGTGLGRVLFPHQATGSLVERDGRVIGSALVAQPFADDRYFQSRPSAAGYDVMALASSNQARTNPDLRTRIDEARAAVAAREGVAPADVPSDLVTQSGGGIDPHLSPAAVRIQIARVARARGIEAAEVERLVAAHTEAPQFGVLGAPRINVLELNLALDAEK
ncbi:MULTISPECIES: potassium-transporting ATPase subunit KdpC [unclassified Pseudoxanthomonas]|uniref:potassium-transporting ATPase subunit KdpC n=1 Tax=unclassified Pseudoxanthomonas TaxID=2645906 RepID=UPI00307F6FFF